MHEVSMKRPKVCVTAYKGLLVISVQQPNVLSEGWTPMGPGRVGCVIADTGTNLGVSEEALELLRRVKRSRDDIGDVDWFKCDDGTHAFAWLGIANCIVDVAVVEGSRSYIVPTDGFVKIMNDVPEDAKIAVDGVMHRMTQPLYNDT